MIENELRAAFARHEEPVVDVARLRVAIDRETARRRSRRNFLRASGAVVAAALAAPLPAVALNLFGHRDRGESEGAAERDGATVPSIGPMNLLLLGIDRRPGQPDYPGAADAIVVVHVPATRDRAFLLSVPRHTRVALPAYRKAGSAPTIDWIGHAFSVGSRNGGGVAGGADLTAIALSKTTGLRFDGTGVIDMAGLARVVDAVGGVNLCVDQRVRSVHTGRVFEPGCRRFRSNEAMDYLRQRVGLPAGALDRDRHIRQFLKALISELLRPDAVANPAKVPQILSAAGSALTVDLPGRSLDDLILEFREISATSTTGFPMPSALITGFPVPVRDLPVSPGETPAAEFVEPLAGELFDAVRRDALAEFLVRHPELLQAG